MKTLFTSLIFLLHTFYIVNVNAVTLTASDSGATQTFGIGVELILTVEGTMISGIDQSWGNVLLKLNASHGSPGAGDLFSILVLEEDTITDDIIFSANNIDPNAFVLNSGFWEYSSALTFDPSIYQDESENPLSITATATVNLNTGFLDTASLSTTPLLQPVVSSVPLPAAAWLFGSGLAGLVGIARRKKAD